MAGVLQLDMDVLGNIPETPGQQENVGSLEEKPWRKAGSRISDYFNYGFDEDSWKAYCKKQRELRPVTEKKKMDYSKIVQIKHRKPRQAEAGCASTSTDRPSKQASRNSWEPTDKTERPAKFSSKPTTTDVTQHQYHRSKENYMKVNTETPSDEDGIPSCQLSLPFSLTFPSACILPPPLLYPRESHVSCSGTPDRGQSGFDDPSCSRCTLSSSGAVRGRAGVTDTAKARKYHSRQGMEKGSGHKKQRKRRTDREKGNSPHNSKKEQMRHRETMERGHRHHSFERFRGRKEERYRKRRHRGKNEELLHSNYSHSRGRSDDGKGRDRSTSSLMGKHQTCREHEKAKRNRKGKENKMSSTAKEKIKM